MGTPRRKKYNTPKKGTKLRALILGLLKPEGLTRKQINSITSYGHTHLTLLQDFGGWDIKGFPVANRNLVDHKKHKTVLSYRIVGRLRFNGGYRSLVCENTLMEGDNVN